MISSGLTERITQAPTSALDAQPTQRASASLPIPAIVFVVSLVVPLVIQIGPLRLSAPRIVLLVTLLPCVFLWVSGRAGPIRKSDIYIVLICIWISILLLARGGAEQIQACGMLVIETMGAYLLARCFIRNPRQFRQLASLLFYIVLAMIPLLMFENLTHEDIILRMFSKIGPVVGEVFIEGRLGFDRAQGPFEHPILLGVFTGSLIGLTFYVSSYGMTTVSKLARCLAIGVAAFTSLSSGPISGVVVQIVLMTWDTVLKKNKSRWRIFGWLTVAAYVFIDLLSNRTPFLVMISYFALNVETGYDRVRIWHWGWVNILEHPFIGIGFADWKRLDFMTPSFDMFWLFHGVYYGIPAMVLYLLTFFSMFVAVCRVNLNDDLTKSCRLGYLMCMVGYFVCGWMVHYWTASYEAFFFMLGTGAWMLEYRQQNPETVSAVCNYGGDRVRQGSRRTVL